MTEEKKEFIKDVEVSIMAVDVAMDQKESNVIKKITFGTSKGNITYKPKMETTEYLEGLRVTKTVSCTIDKIPTIIKQIGNEIRLNGTCHAKVSYNYWETDTDGVKKTFRYIQAPNLAKWEITSKKISEESIG